MISAIRVVAKTVLTVLFAGAICLPLASASGVAPNVAMVTVPQCFAYAPKQVNDSTATLQILNTGAMASPIMLQLYETSGAPASTVSSTAPPAGIVQFNLASFNLPDGVYSACIGSSEPFLATALLETAPSRTMGVYRATEVQQRSRRFFGPFFSIGESAPAHSKLILQNAGNSAATITLRFVGGSAASNSYTLNADIPVRGIATWSSDDLVGKVAFDENVGWAIVEAPAGVTVIGVLENTLPAGQKIYFEEMGEQAAGAASIQMAQRFAVPRLHRNSNETLAVYNSRLYAGNLSNSQATMTGSLFAPDGDPIAPLPAQALGAEEIAELPLGQSGVSAGVVSAMAGSNQPFAIANLATTDSGANFSVDSYSSAPFSDVQVLPSLLRSRFYLSVIGVQNISSVPARARIELFLYSTAGLSTYDATVTIPANATYSLDPNNVSSLPGTFTGFARVASLDNAPLVAQVDLYSSVLTAPVSSLAIEGPTLVTMNESVVFTALASPTDAVRPITYTWSSGIVISQTQVTAALTATVNAQWATPGVQSVQVVAVNPLGAVTATHTVTVVADSVLIEAGQAAKLNYSDATDNSVMLNVPADASSPGYLLTLTPILLTDEEILPGDEVNFFALPLAVELAAYQNGQVATGYTFSPAAILEMSYAGVDIGDIDETDLVIVTRRGESWIDAAKTCSPDGAYTRMPEQKRIQIEICHLSPFHLAALEVNETEETRVFLPYVNQE